MKRADLWASTSDRVNASVLDEWSVVHVAAGVGAAAVGMSGWTFSFLVLGYEVLEYLHESPSGSPLFGSKRPEWEINMVADLAVALGAFALTAWLQGRMPPKDAT